MSGSQALWRGRDPLILASRSAARRAMLEAAGIPVEIRPSDVDERAVPEAPAQTLAARLAEAKARDVAARHPGRLVVGADQTLALGHALLHKPADRAEAIRQLLAMAGREHVLASAAALVRDGALLGSASGAARIRIRPLDEAMASLYLDAAGPDVLQSVGLYHVEGLGAHLFEALDGDPYTIMGLPLVPLMAHLRACGAVAA
ncbi:MAG: nucleoside triphosphate pyrophosphatase [Alsobacter sp.]